MGVLHNFKLKDFATLLGTFCGVFSIYIAIDYHAYRAAAVLIFVSILADFLDGYIARRTKTFNDFGKELDSLSDSLAFGIAPAIITFLIYTKSPASNWGIHPIPGYIMLVPTFLFIAGAIVRLAWFNIRNVEDYEGLPTPMSASALSLATLVDYFAWYINESPTLFNRFMLYFVPVFMIFLGFCNVTELIRYDDTVFHKTGWLKYMMITLFICVAVLMILMNNFRDEARIFIFIIVVLLFSLVVFWIVFGYKTGIKYRKGQKEQKVSEDAQKSQNRKE